MCPEIGLPCQKSRKSPLNCTLILRSNHSVVFRTVFLPASIHCFATALADASLPKVQTWQVLCSISRWLLNCAVAHFATSRQTIWASFTLYLTWSVRISIQGAIALRCKKFANMLVVLIFAEFRCGCTRPGVKPCSDCAG